MRKIIIFLLITSFIYINVRALEVNEICVDIKGAVNLSGTYKMEAGSRVSDLIKAAGGLKEYADTSLINLSKKLSDQDVVIIYTTDEVLEMRRGDTAVKVVEKECMCPKIENIGCIASKPKFNMIDINKASKEELETLEGIGSSKADAIIEYRNSKPFTSIEEIMKVKGIGKTIYEKIKDSIRV